VVVKAQSEDAALLEAQRLLVENMANTESLLIAEHATKPEASTVVLGSGMETYIVLAGLVDFDAERARLEKEREKLAKDEQKLAKKLSNEGFLAKAAPEIIEKDRAKHAELADKIARIDGQLAELG
jgi:valyl-tRNA synthetase